MAGGKKDKRSVVKYLMTVSVVGAGLMFLWMLAAHPGISGLVSGEVFVKGLVFLVGLWVVPGLVLIVILLFSKGSGRHNFFWGEGRKAQAIQKSGRAATATVLRIDESGLGGASSLDEEPFLHFKLRIEGDFTKPYEVSLATLIPRKMVPQFKPGLQFGVRVDSKNPNKIVIAGGD